MAQNSIKDWTDILPDNIVESINDRLDACDKLRLTETIYPAQEDILKALETTSPDNLKAVIIGQDPYHGEGQAIGLSFAVRRGKRLPPSLRNIYEELHNDIGCPAPHHGDLTAWAEQGVLLLNASLTVKAGQPNSMADFGWKPIVKEIIGVTLRLRKPIVYICWSAFAQNLVDEAVHHIGEKNVGGKKYIIKSTHPSPFSAYTVTKSSLPFFGSCPFSRTNSILTGHGISPIDWRIE